MSPKTGSTRGVTSVRNGVTVVPVGAAATRSATSTSMRSAKLWDAVRAVAKICTILSRPRRAATPPTSMSSPAKNPVVFAFLTPRSLPRPETLAGRVAVLDIAFAAEGGGSSFEGITLPFINGLGARLAAWVDHHDHERHKDYANDPRFVLSTKAEH